MRASYVGLFVAAALGCGGAAFTVAAGTASDGGDGDGATGGGGMDAMTLSDGAPLPPEDSGGKMRDGGGRSDASEGTDATNGTDATGGGGDASGGSDTGVTSDTGASDTGTGAPDAGADAAAFRCTTPPPATVVFCSDFDESTSPPWEWEIALANNDTGTNTADTTDFLSPSHGYASSIPTLLPTNQATFASLEKQLTLPSGAGHVAYDFSAYVKQVDALANDSFPVARLVVGQGTGSLFLNLILSKNALSLQQMTTESDGGSLEKTTPLSTVSAATGVWTHLAIVFDRSAMGTVSVSVNGALVINALPTIATPASTAIEVDLGILDLIPPTGGTNAVTFDNVTVRAY